MRMATVWNRLRSPALGLLNVEEIAAREALERASARVVGAVLNGTRPGLGAYYYYAYGYHRPRDEVASAGDPFADVTEGDGGDSPSAERDSHPAVEKGRTT